MIFESRKKSLFIDHEVPLAKKALEAEKSHGINKIVTLTSGTDHIDLNAAKELGIKIENRPGINASAVSQWAIKQALDYCYKQEPPIELNNKNTTIIGYGKIGQELERILSGFDCYNAVFDTKFNHEYPDVNLWQINTIESLKKSLEISDFVFLCIPLIGNEGWFDQKIAENLKESVCVINISRPGVIATSGEVIMRNNKITFISDEQHLAWRTKETIEKQQKEIR